MHAIIAADIVRKCAVPDSKAAACHLHEAASNFAAIGKQGPMAILFVVAILALIVLAIRSGAKRLGHGE